MNTLEQLNALTLQQLRALCSQAKLPCPLRESRAQMLKALVKYSEENSVDLLLGVRA